MDALNEPRWPAVTAKRGHYESWYLKAAEPGGSRAVWIRYTVHKRPNRAPQGSLWLTLFDHAAGRPFAVKQTAALSAAKNSGEQLITVDGLGSFSPVRADGAIQGAGRSASWQLDISTAESPFIHLPERLYAARLPRTKLLTMQPQASFSGVVDFGDSRLEIDQWRGMTGHNWGSQHAEEWVWLHAADFGADHPQAWFDVALGRIRIGPWTTPWVANGALSLGSERHRLGGIGAVRSTHVGARAGSCEFELAAKALKVKGSIAAPAEDTVAWVYSDPDGSEHHALNCSISRIELDVVRAGSTLGLSSPGAVYEYGSRNTDHGIVVEPFSDG